MNVRALISDFRVYLQPQPVRMFLLGFSSGLPLLLILGTLSFWLREAGVDLKTIGFFSWIGLVYGFKWVWAPAVDRLRIPVLGRLLGRRRSWLLLSQAGVIAALAGMAVSDPLHHLQGIMVFALMCAFFSATQDIALDAYRIESADSNLQAVLAAMYQTGYRLAMIWAGAGTLALAAWSAGGETGYFPHAWEFAYLGMAASMCVGVLTVLFVKEPEAPVRPVEAVSRSWLERFAINVVAPFRDFFVRFGWGAAGILLLIATYRISDIVMGVMANPFYSDTGFTKEEIATVSKVFGVVMTLAGAFVGGIVTMRLGILKTMAVGAVLAAVTNLLFAALAGIGHNVGFLIFTVSADNLAAGLASAAFIAYLSSLTNKAYSATQYALFSSLMLLLPKFIAGFSGVMVESLGYQGFFLLTASMGVPVILLVWWVIKVRLDFRKVARHVVGQMTEDTEQGAVDAVVRAVLETFPAVDHFGEAEGERNDGGHAVGAPHGTAAVVLDLVDDRIDGAAARKRRVDGAVAAVDEFLQTVLFVGIRQSGVLTGLGVEDVGHPVAGRRLVGQAQKRGEEAVHVVGLHRLERFGHGGKQFAEFDELVIVQRFFVGIAHRVVDGSATFLFWKASSS